MEIRISEKNVRFAYPEPVIVLFLNERNKLYSIKLNRHEFLVLHFFCVTNSS